MDVPMLDPVDLRAGTQRLLGGLAHLMPHVHAVVDGGHFDDLPGMLCRAGIEGRSLFRAGVAADVRRGGPWLVGLAAPAAHDFVGDLAAEAPCAVFWSFSGDEEVLWRHLRTINEVLLPLEVSRGGASEAGSEQVLFRHWDPNVLAAVLPVLTPSQLSRFLGPAEIVLMNAPDYGGPKRARRPDPPVPPAPGLLRFDAAQIERLRQAMLHSSRLRTARFLRGHVPPHFSGIDDGFVWGATLASEKSANELGIRTEQGRTRWAYVMMMSDGRSADLPEVRAYITDGRDTPDNRVRMLIGHTVDALRCGNSVTP